MYCKIRCQEHVLILSGYSITCCRFLDAGYRRPLILAELLGFNADVICLQEVDEKAFAVYFRPHLHTAGAHQPEATICHYSRPCFSMLHATVN